MENAKSFRLGKKNGHPLLENAANKYLVELQLQGNKKSKFPTLLNASKASFLNTVFGAYMITILIA